MPISRQRLLFSWSVGLRVCFCLFVSGYDFWCIFCRFGLQLGTPGTLIIHLEFKNHQLGAPFGGCGPQGQIFCEFGMHFGSHFGHHFAHRRSFVGLLLHFGSLFVVMFLIWCRVPLVGRTMWLPYSKYCIRMRFPMLGKGSILDQFWNTFCTLLEHFWETFGTDCR